MVLPELSTYITGPYPKLGQFNYPHPVLEYDELAYDEADMWMVLKMWMVIMKLSKF